MTGAWYHPVAGSALVCGDTAGVLRDRDGHPDTVRAGRDQLLPGASSKGRRQGEARGAGWPRYAHLDVSWVAFVAAVVPSSVRYIRPIHPCNFASETLGGITYDRSLLAPQ
eukprot:scaffold2325_cov374-Prasinococcus_capsulatus_cf.AAC.9